MKTLKENFFNSQGLGVNPLTESLINEGEGYDAGLAGEMNPKTYYNMFTPSKENMIKQLSDFAKKSIEGGAEVSVMFSDGREYPLQKIATEHALQIFIQEINNALATNDREAIKDYMRVFFKIPNAAKKKINLKMTDFIKFLELFIQK
jgi:hypothetical protein